MNIDTLSTNVNRWEELSHRDHRPGPWCALRIRKVDTEDIRRRLKAGRALAEPTEEEIAARSERKRDFVGITMGELAERLDEPGLGFKTLGAIERGDREARRRDLIVIADALALPAEFFSVSPRELYQRLAGSSVLGIQGATGRRVGALRPSQEAPGQPETHEEEGRSHGEP